MVYRIPDSFMEPFIIRTCEKCGLDHAAIRTCEETKHAKEVSDGSPAHGQG